LGRRKRKAKREARKLVKGVDGELTGLQTEKERQGATRKK